MHNLGLLLFFVAANLAVIKNNIPTSPLEGGYRGVKSTFTLGKQEMLTKEPCSDYPHNPLSDERAPSRSLERGYAPSASKNARVSIRRYVK